MRRAWSIVAAFAFLAVAASSASAASVASLPRDASVLFALDARSGSLTPTPGHGGQYTLILRGIARGTTWFSDRPQRDAGSVTTRSLLGSWRRLGFVADAPNAAVVLDGGRAARDTVALELRLRGHDDARRTARFSARVLKGLGPGLSHLNKRLDRRLPRHFAGASLFIDDVTLGSCSVGQPRLFGFSRIADESSYVQANGQLLPIGEYPALFALYGTRFGGDGQQSFGVPELPSPLPGMSWQLCANGANQDFTRMPDCATGELMLWWLGDTPVSAVDAAYWLPADGRTVASADYPGFAFDYLGVSAPPTFALPNAAAPPGFAYLACVAGENDVEYGEPMSNYVGQVDLFALRGYPEDRAAGGFVLAIATNSALFQLLGTTFGGNGETTFVTPAAPSPVPQFAYRTATFGFWPPG